MTSTGIDLFWIIFFTIIGLGFLILMIAAFIDSEVEVGFGCFIITVIIAIGLWSGISSYINRTSYTEYKILIDNSVKMNEFNKKYYIKNQDGNIYTVILKDERQ